MIYLAGKIAKKGVFRHNKFLKLKEIEYVAY